MEFSLTWGWGCPAGGVKEIFARRPPNQGDTYCTLNKGESETKKEESEAVVKMMGPLGAIRGIVWVGR